MRLNFTPVIACLLAVWLTSPAAAQDAAKPAEEGFVPLFNGKDLSNWVLMNVHPGTFTVKDEMIVSTGVPTGIMRTDRMYENFVMELEYKHLVPGGNAGLFIWGDGINAPGTPFARGIEVQILDGFETDWATSHGDIFSIHGATCVPDRPHPKGAMRCLPSERRAKPAGEWNHYRVECNDGVIKLAVNGKVVSGVSKCSLKKGYICLESEGGKVHYRNIRIKELPSTNAKPEETARVDPGYTLLYNGIDLAGWVQDAGHKGHWKPKDWILDYDGKSEAKDPNLWSEKEYGDFELMVDWRFTGKPKQIARPVILPNGEVAKNEDGSEKTVMVADAGDSGVYLRGSSKAQVNMWHWPVGSGEVYGYRTDPKMSPEVRAGVTPKAVADKKVGAWNRFIITMKGDRLTVVLNGQTVIENAQLPDVPAKGKIALQHHGDPIQFANIWIKELPAGPSADAAGQPSPAVVKSEFIYATAAFPSVHASTIAQTKAGLVAAFFGGTAEGNKDVGIWMSRHDGNAWSSPTLAFDGQQPDGTRHPCWNPVLHAMKDGSLALFYKVGPSPRNWWGMLATSLDGGQTWSAPRRLPDGILGPIKNKAIDLADGRLLCPSSTEDNGWRSHMEFATPAATVDGWTFSRTDALNDSQSFGLIQPTLLRHGGKLIALNRSRNTSKVVQMDSNDDGKTWSSPVNTELPNPNSGIDGVTLVDGRSLLVYNHTPKARSPLNVALSADGKAWKPAVVLESEKGEYSYPAVIQTSDGMVHITYTWHRKKVKHVVIDPKKLES